MTWMGAHGAPEHLDELKTMHEDGHEHRSLQLDRQRHGCSLILMPLTVTALGMGEDFGKFDPKFAAAICVQKFGNICVDDTRDVNRCHDSKRHSIVDPPLSPLYSESIPRSDAALEIFGRVV